MRRYKSMKKVLTFEGRRRVYDTATAKLLGEWRNRDNPRDFSYCYEALYVTKSGAYFLYGEGGPMSKYSRQIGSNNWSGDEVIIPMTLAEAQKWAEKHLDGEEYIAAFGDPEETDGVEALKISLQPSTIKKLERLRSETGKSISQIVEEKFTE
jgi:hypothetical protein